MKFHVEAPAEAIPAYELDGSLQISW
jgi:hypothetical protein